MDFFVCIFLCVCYVFHFGWCVYCESVELRVCVFLVVCGVVWCGVEVVALSERSNSPEYENEKDEQGEEDGHIVHGAEHDEELAAQVGHETDQFQDAEQAESPKDGQSGAAASRAVAHELLADLDGTVDGTELYY